VNDQPLPECTIERFAELVAIIDDGSVPRARILQAAGFDEIAWKRVEGHWMEHLAAGNDHDLAARFGTVYGRTKYSLSSTPRAASLTTPSGENEGSAEEGAQATANVDDTLPTGVAPPSDVNDTLPDQATSDADVGCDPAPVPEAIAAPEGVDLTIECAPDAAARHVFPFVAPASPAGVAPPGKRWAYYDTQTGERLPAPVLIDVPDPPQH
jgi:hypothetical protein